MESSSGSPAPADDRAAALVTSLGEHLGIAGLSLDEEGQCLLSFEEEFLVSLRVDDSGWAYAGFLAEWEPDEDIEVALDNAVHLLTINLQLGATGRGTIGLDTSSDSLLLIAPILPAPESGQDLIAALERVMESMEWVRELREQASGNRETPPPGPEPFHSSYIIP